MIQILRKRVQRRDQQGEEGFTLIELMVVVLIIAILLAIAIPTFLGARNRANDRAAQSSLRNALTAAKVIFTDEQNYLQATIAKLDAEEPALTFAANSTDPKTVAVYDGAAPNTASLWHAGAFSKSGTCFYIKDNSAGAGDGTTFLKVTGQTTCAGYVATPAAPGYVADGWD